MLTPEEHANWRLRIEAAEARYCAAKLRAGESAIERLTLLERDGTFAHFSALREETLALKAYTALLAEYSRLVSSSDESHGS